LRIYGYLVRDHKDLFCHKMDWVVCPREFKVREEVKSDMRLDFLID